MGTRLSPDDQKANRRAHIFSIRRKLLDAGYITFTAACRDCGLKTPYLARQCRLAILRGSTRGWAGGARRRLLAHLDQRIAARRAKGETS